MLVAFFPMERGKKIESKELSATIARKKNVYLVAEGEDRGVLRFVYQINRKRTFESGNWNTTRELAKRFKKYIEAGPIG